MMNNEPISKIFVTCNTVYGVRDQRIVAVRRRGESEWLKSHRTLGMLVVSDPKQVEIGDTLRLAGREGIVTTSRIVDMRRGNVMSKAA
jgi:hypothetical protein